MSPVYQIDTYSVIVSKIPVITLRTGPPVQLDKDYNRVSKTRQQGCCRVLTLPAICHFHLFGTQFESYLTPST